MHVLATFTNHHDPDPDDPNFDPLAGGGEETSFDAAALGALDAAIADQPLPEETAPADPPEGKKPAESEEGVQPDLLDQALAGDPAGETPEARQARELATQQAADKATKDKADADAAAAAAGKTPEQIAEDDRKKKVDDEVAALRAELKAEGKELSPKGEARFRAAAETISQQQVQLETVAKAFGVDFAKPEEAANRLALVAENARAGTDMVNLVMETGSTPEQYTMALDYLAVANKANGGDVKAAEQAWTWLLEELTHYAGVLGRELPGLVDPLKEHPDLVADVEDMNLTRERALEIAAGRNATKRTEDQRKAVDQQRQTQTQQAKDRDTAINAGRTALNELGQQLAANDPGGIEAYKAKQPALVALVKDVTSKFPPDQWVSKVSVGYLALKAPGAQVKTPAPSGGPLRPSGPTGSLQPEFDDPYAALDAGVLDADRGS